MPDEPNMNSREPWPDLPILPIEIAQLKKLYPYLGIDAPGDGGTSRAPVVSVYHYATPQPCGWFRQTTGGSSTPPVILFLMP